MPVKPPTAQATTNALRAVATAGHPSGVAGSFAWRQQVERLDDKLCQPSRVSRKTYQSGIVAIDPGDVHVGLAVGAAMGTEKADDELFSAFEVYPTVALQSLHTAILAGWIDTVVLETFRLRPDLAKEQVGSDMRTCQMIGAIKWLVLQHNEAYQASQPYDDGYVRLVLQDPDIKLTTKAFLTRFGIKPESKGSDHARDAELHWWHFVLKQRNLLTGKSPLDLTRPNDYALL